VSNIANTNAAIPIIVNTNPMIPAMKNAIRNIYADTPNIILVNSLRVMILTIIRAKGTKQPIPANMKNQRLFGADTAIRNIIIDNISILMANNGGVIILSLLLCDESISMKSSKFIHNQLLIFSLMLVYAEGLAQIS